MKSILSLLVLSALCMAELPIVGGSYEKNWNGYTSRDTITDTLPEDTIRYTDAFGMSTGENIRLLVLFDDTSSAGFAADSVNFEYGAQWGVETLDINGNRVIAWDVPFVIDTASVDSFGVLSSGGTLTPAGDWSRTWGQYSDTTNIPGFAYQIRSIIPEWAVYIRYYAKGLAGNRAAAPNILIFQHNYRSYQPVRTYR